LHAKPENLKFGPQVPQATKAAHQFKKIDRLFTFLGVINGVSLLALITPTGTLRYAFVAAAERARRHHDFISTADVKRVDRRASARAGETEDVGFAKAPRTTWHPAAFSL
jgi:hypothetical protein